jgi:8-oxo-dGTP diphosphatase
MRFVYAVGFEGDRYLMVFNRKRNGWEMPGGHIEEDESPEQAIMREYLEESGFRFTPLAKCDMEEVAIFARVIKPMTPVGEMSWELFEEMPSQLAFPEVEYDRVIEWARRRLSRQKSEIRETTKT